MINALHAEWGKTWSVRSSWLSLAGVVVVVLVTALALAGDVENAIRLGERSPDSLVSAAEVTGPAAQFGIAVFAAFAMLLITAEYSSGSIRSTFQAAPRRTLVLRSKTCIAAGVGLVAGTITGAAGLGIATFVLNDHVAPAPEPLAVTALRIGLIFTTSAVLVVGLGAIIRSAVGTLAAALVLLVGSIVLPVSVSVWTPGGAIGEFILASDATYPAIMGLVVNVGWATAAFGGAVWSLRYRDA